MAHKDPKKRWRDKNKESRNRPKNKPYKREQNTNWKNLINDKPTN